MGNLEQHKQDDQEGHSSLSSMIRNQDPINLVGDLVCDQVVDQPRKPPDILRTEGGNQARKNKYSKISSASPNNGKDDDQKQQQNEKTSKIDVPERSICRKKTKRYKTLSLQREKNIFLPGPSND